MSKTSSNLNTKTRLSRVAIAMILPLGLIFGLTWSPTSASAQDAAKKQATKFYKQGTTKFKLGDFDAAIALFKKAYETSPHHAFLFNLGQAYRQKGECKQAIFFYKGYLAEAGSKAKNRAVVESHIKELKQICKAQEDNKDKPPNGSISPDDDGKTNGDNGTSGDPDDAKDPDRGTDVAAVDNNAGTEVGITSGPPASSGGLHDSMEPWRPSLLSASVKAGPSLLSFGDGVEVAGARPTISLNAGFPIHFGKIGLTLGGMFTYTPIQWELGEMSGTSTLISALAHVGVRYWVMDKFAIGADFAGGGLFLGGLTDGNLFLDPDTEATGTLTMLNVRVGLAAEYLITDNLMISASPFVYSMSPPKTGLRAEVESLTRMEFMLGMGYRL